LQIKLQISSVVLTAFPFKNKTKQKNPNKQTTQTLKTTATLNTHFLSFGQRHHPNLLIRDFPLRFVRIDNLLLLLPITTHWLNAAQTTKYSR